eukprot:s4393_g6.t1
MHGVKCNSTGYFVGLLVQERFAQRFVTGPEEDRKVMEVKHMKYDDLVPGDRVLLVADGDARVAIAALEFESIFVLSEANFKRFFGCHQMSQAEFGQFKDEAPDDWDRKIHGYQFQLIAAFSKPLSLDMMAKDESGWCAVPVNTVSRKETISNHKATSSSSSSKRPASGEEPAKKTRRKEQLVQVKEEPQESEEIVAKEEDDNVEAADDVDESEPGEISSRACYCSLLNGAHLLLEFVHRSCVHML